MQHRLKHKFAARDPLCIDDRAKIEEALTGLDIAFDHPIQRSAVKQLFGAPWLHAGGVKLLGRSTGCFLRGQPALDPAFEIVDAVSADA